ncbi:MAG: COX15/CtaA family protein [Gammaproteobacteria bacterium]|uniref:COX15/CtaA family protein n=1 Tax=Rhodoferax sp. TaxID=50421 RepID=UPI0018100E98|nr:COX15/CtaA family protein [Rhodoferax sp.]MBU3898643.1 COX15/CtaA family protein [Gammaproteobacteria bacterium]MBA3057040.1 heme A synthase [Rhodoferax sp.]MBU3997746.1 COX15/CtaA family protein [Gammaproteobacteria bacterium]MBU4019552.1 COX15/CtaA family protein [Gammaproteobacteria bacterium]MBU4079066.1 COX15/CtaA family protein [Gammaproteobacteria bacterium]
MTVQALYDLSPLMRMMFFGAILALAPLTWVWFRHRRASPLGRVQALTILTLFLTFDLVLFGAFTRLTDSGLGCPDWPGCYGNASPLGAHAEIAAAQSAMPTGPVTAGKAWVEMIHRYLATSVGVLILVLTAVAWLGRSSGGRNMQVHPISPWWPTLTLLWVCIQGAFGALTVTMKLFPAIVTLHLLGGLVLLAMLCVQVVQFAQLEGRFVPVTLSPGLRWLLALSFVLLVLQSALGGWVSTNYAVLACTDFPKCQGRWWPLMDFREGFEFWRHLGVTGSGEYISFAALTAIHYVHRLMAFLVLALLGLLAWRLNRVAALRKPAGWIAALSALQLATGLSNVVLDWPLLAAVLHTGGAAALVLVLTWTVATTRTGDSVKAAVPKIRTLRQTA